MATMALATISVSAATYPTDAQISVGFEPDSILFVNRSSTAADIVYISFDGVTDHGLLIPSLVPALEFREKRRYAWLRRDSGASTTSVNVMAGRP